MKSVKIVLQKFPAIQYVHCSVMSTYCRTETDMVEDTAGSDDVYY